ncbi:pentatricopeptide repeat-containing protein At5g66500, mitochondrial-like [Tasmannia lanceolata]|uniref:pentatricopeptide repeat-containing protein At5g66500, mitochondrial-like n=1 Tax=Tasmannia lanceolata TaxID=3420 RepID=UPI004063255F
MKISVFLGSTQLAKIYTNAPLFQKGAIKWQKRTYASPRQPFPHKVFDEMPQRKFSSPNAHVLFDSMPPRKPISPNAHVLTGDPWLLFRRMHASGFELDSYAFMPIISACSALSNRQCAVQVHALLIKTGSGSETVVKTALIDMYSKCSSLGDSTRVFEETKLKDVVAWNAMLSGFVRHGFVISAIACFREMLKNKVEFSEFTLCSLLKMCGRVNALRQGKQIHALTIVRGCDLLVLGTALIDLYSNCGFLEDAIQVFCNLNWVKDDVIYNVLLSGCVKNHKYKEAFFMLGRMEPDGIALTTVLDACSELSDLSNGKQIHCVIIRRGFEIDTILCNALLDMYAKCGKINSARLVFDRIRDKNVVSWTGIIDAYGSHGFGKEALKLYENMVCSGISPNSVTFLAILSACGHSGLVGEAWECFILMREKHNFDLGPEHYACFIDLLGRAGRINEAWELFHEMSNCNIKSTGVVWASLLNACRVNQDVVRGEFAAKNLLELEPEKPGNYVLLSNFYAAVGRWEGVEELRKVMREKGLRKEVGSSWIAVECCKNGENTCTLSSM